MVECCDGWGRWLCVYLWIAGSPLLGAHSSRNRKLYAGAGGVCHLSTLRVYLSVYLHKQVSAAAAAATPAAALLLQWQVYAVCIIVLTVVCVELMGMSMHVHAVGRGMSWC